MEKTSIEVTKEQRNKLKRMKVHPNQPYYEVIERLIKEIENEG
nr:hypothetical protein [uncultured archaeon]